MEMKWRGGIDQKITWNFARNLIMLLLNYSLFHRCFFGVLSNVGTAPTDIKK